MKDKTIRAVDVMMAPVVSVRPELLVQELAQLFDDKGISGAPVIDELGLLLGVVSKTDLVHHQHADSLTSTVLKPKLKTGTHPYYRMQDVEVLPRGFHEELPDRTTVRDIMTPAIISATAQTPAQALARLMRTKHIHRIFITEKGKLLGVVSTMDLLKLLDGSFRVPKRKGR